MKTSKSITGDFILKDIKISINKKRNLCLIRGEYLPADSNQKKTTLDINIINTLYQKLRKLDPKKKVRVKLLFKDVKDIPMLLSAVLRKIEKESSANVIIHWK